MSVTYLSLAVRVDLYGRARVIQRMHSVERDEARCKFEAMNHMMKLGGARVCGGWRVTADGMESVFASYTGIKVSDAMKCQTLLMDEAAVYSARIRDDMAAAAARQAGEVVESRPAVAQVVDFERERREAQEWATAQLRMVRDVSGGSWEEVGKHYGWCGLLPLGSSPAAGELQARYMEVQKAAGWEGLAAPMMGREVRVAVLATGCNSEAARYWPEVREVIDCTACGGGGWDAAGVGTAMVSVLKSRSPDGQRPARADGAWVYPIQVAESTTGQMLDRQLALGVATAVRLGCHVIIIGGGAPVELPTAAEEIRRAVLAGRLVIAAGGMASAAGEGQPWPACRPDVLAAGWCGTDGRLSALCHDAGGVDVYAPGEHVPVVTLEDKWSVRSGSAISAAMVGAAAAVVWAMYRVEYGTDPAASAVWGTLTATSVMPDTGAEVPFSGPGLLQAEEAWQAVSDERADVEAAGVDTTAAGKGRHTFEAVKRDRLAAIMATTAAGYWANHAKPGDQLTITMTAAE